MMKITPEIEKVREESIIEIRSKFRRLVIYLAHNSYKRIKATGSNLSIEDFVGDIENELWRSILTKYLNHDGTFSEQVVNKNLIRKITSNIIFDTIKSKNNHRKTNTLNTDSHQTIITTDVGKFKSYEELKEAKKLEHLEYEQNSIKFPLEESRTLNVFQSTIDESDLIILQKLRDGYTHEKIADEIGVSKKTVQRKFKALQIKIKSSLEASDLTEEVIEDLLN